MEEVLSNRLTNKVKQQGTVVVCGNKQTNKHNKQSKQTNRTKRENTEHYGTDNL